MNLVLDIGNSSTKIAIYDGTEKITTFRSKELSCEYLEKLLLPNNINRAIISSVRETPEDILALLSFNIPDIHNLSYKSRLPFKIEYDTPDTLGADRIAAAAGAFNLFSGEEILIIDAGTAITYDYISATSFKGGNISPGLMMRFRALNSFTGKLPLVSPKDNYSFPGRNSIDAIRAGVITGIIYEINEYIRTFVEKNTDFKIIMTGGDSSYFKDKINHQITYKPDIVIDGLNYILEYNV